MSQIPDDILETLICTECACYLSYGPICLKIEGGAVCGRCLLPDNSYVTDIPYENLAKIMNFPCRYKKDGCKHEAKFGEVKTHEDDCDYRKCFCPVITDGSCKWKGTVKQILEHVENDHIDKLLTHPCTVPYSFTEKQTNIYITSISDFLFLIYLESSVSTRKIRHWVRILSSKAYAQHFEFNLRIESPDNKNIQQNARVLPFLSESEDDLVTSVNVLQDFFETLEDIKFVVTINVLGNQKCSTCQEIIKKFVCLIGDEYKCEKCLPALITCGNCCAFQDIKTKVRKHQSYFCSKLTSCINCYPDAEFGFGKNIKDYLREHIKKVHLNLYHNSNSFKTINISRNDTISNNSRQKKQKNIEEHVINTEIGQIICVLQTYQDYYSLQDRFSLDIYTPLPSNELDNYDCYVEIHNLEDNYKFEGFLLQENEMKYDWTLVIDNLKDSDFKSEVELKVTFPKRDIQKHPQLRE